MSTVTAHNDNCLRVSGSSQFLPKIYTLSYEEFNTEFCKYYCLEAFIYRLRRPKSSLSLISLGGVQMQAEVVRKDNC
jgi:hypothetical protein